LENIIEPRKLVESDAVLAFCNPRCQMPPLLGAFLMSPMQIYR